MPANRALLTVDRGRRHRDRRTAPTSPWSRVDRRYVGDGTRIERDRPVPGPADVPGRFGHAALRRLAGRGRPTADRRRAAPRPARRARVTDRPGARRHDQHQRRLPAAGADRGPAAPSDGQQRRRGLVRGRARHAVTVSTGQVLVGGTRRAGHRERAELRRRSAAVRRRPGRASEPPSDVPSDADQRAAARAAVVGPGRPRPRRRPRPRWSNRRRGRTRRPTRRRRPRRRRRSPPRGRRPRGRRPHRRPSPRSLADDQARRLRRTLRRLPSSPDPIAERNTPGALLVLRQTGAGVLPLLRPRGL